MDGKIANYGGRGDMQVVAAAMMTRCFAQLICLFQSRHLNCSSGPSQSSRCHCKGVLAVAAAAVVMPMIIYDVWGRQHEAIFPHFLSVAVFLRGHCRFVRAVLHRQQVPVDVASMRHQPQHLNTFTPFECTC
jgi:hypothetical protein